MPPVEATPPAAAPAAAPAAPVATPAAPVAPAATPAAPVAPAAPAAPVAAPLIAVPPPAPPPPPPELVMPEGFKADDKLLAGFKPLASEFGLDVPKAQKLVDLYAGAVKASALAAETAWAEQQGKWAEDVKADKELGGAAFEKTKVDVARFFGAHDKDGSIRQAINELGLGNHPALVRLAVRASAALAEDGTALRQAAGGGETDAQAVLRARYPSMFKTA